MNFFSIIKEVCVNPAIFRRIRNIPFYKGVYHLVFLALLCTVFIFLCRAWSVFTTVKHTCIEIDKHTGGIHFSSTGIYPVKNPGEKKYLYLNNGTGLIYLPDYKQDISIISTYSKTGILWLPHIAVYWQRVDLKNILFLPFFILPSLSPQSIAQLRKTGVIDIKHLNDWLKKCGKIITSSAKTEKNKHDKSTFDNIAAKNMVVNIASFDFIILFSLFVLCVKYALLPFLTIIFFTFLYNGICVGVYHILNSLSQNNMSFLQLLVISIYSGVPAIIVATISVALDLPFLDYQTIYLTGFLIYFFIILGKIQKSEVMDN